MAADVESDVASRAIRKLTWRIVPIAALMYLLAYLDRVNLGFAALTMNADLKLTSTAYGAAAGILTLTYVLCEVPSNILLHKFGARRWLARIMITWGICCAAMSLAQGPMSLAGLRLALGAAEAGLTPGILFYLSLWFPVRYRTRIMSGFFIAVPTSYIIGAPLSTALLGLNWFGLHGWQWMFIIEGAVTVLVGFYVLRNLLDKPEDAKWLAPDEREWLLGTLRGEFESRGGHKVSSLRQGLTNPLVWFLGLTYFGQLAANATFGFWLPLMIKNAGQALGGFSNFETGLLTTIPYIAAVFGLVFWAKHSAAKQELTWHYALPPLIGAVAFSLATIVDNPVVLAFFVSITVFCVAIVPPIFWTMATKSFNGPAAAASTALINCIASVGSYFGPQAMGALRDAYGGSFEPGMLMVAGCLLVAGVTGIAMGRRIERQSIVSA